MPGIRAEQKEKTRQCIIDAALAQLSAEKSFSNLSLREVTRHAGIAPTSFYRHFSDMEELGITLVDQCGVTLRQLMRKARSRIEEKRSAITTSVDTFLEFIQNNPNVFRLLLRERSGTSALFRSAISNEINHFRYELTDYLIKDSEFDKSIASHTAEAIVILVFSSGAKALDLSESELQEMRERLIFQLRCIIIGAQQYASVKKAADKT